MDLIDEIRNAEARRLVERMEGGTHVFVVGHSGDTLADGILNVYNVGGVKDLLDCKEGDVLVFSPDQVRLAELAKTFADVLELDIRKMEGFPGASNEPTVLSVFEGLGNVSYHRVVGDLLATREVLDAMSEEERAASIAKAEVKRRSNKRGEVKQLDVIDFNHWKSEDAGDDNIAGDDEDGNG